MMDPCSHASITVHLTLHDADGGIQHSVNMQSTVEVMNQ